MFTIHLNNLQFFSFHGIHEEERVLGNSYEVNVALTIEGNEQVTALEQTVNYELVYSIVRERMEIPTGLLETVAQDLAHNIQSACPLIRSISVSIEKKNPPMATFHGSVAITYKKEF